MSCELGLKETTEPTGGTQKESIGVAPLMARQPPVVVVSGGEFAVASHDRRHARLRRALLLPPSLPVFLLL